jgi:nitroimidazol reductase NimA-like FMN-containing flavoprotein (pyridoxamine 5'-phosphate oxidase superfamily)
MGFFQDRQPVCVEIENHTPNLSQYSFVTLTGTLIQVEDGQEKQKAITIMAQTGLSKLSTNFLAAHGMEPKTGWENFGKNQTLIIAKLEVTAKKGLKSP